MAGEESSGSTPYGDKLGDVDKTVSTVGTLINAFDKFFFQPSASWIGSRQQQKDTELALGIWHDYLYDSKWKAYYTPCLSSDALRSHFQNRNGSFQPQGQCTASFAWAQLLHALAITPDLGVLSRLSPNPDAKITKPEDLKLQVDGMVICDIVNFFGVRYPDRRAGLFANPTQEDECSVGFGRIKWNLTTKPMTIEFLPGAEVIINAAHFAFRNRWGTAPDQAWPAYMAAMEHGVSDGDGIWPPRDAPLPTRIAKLDENMSRFNCGLPNVLLTPKWLQSANLVRKHTGGSSCGDGTFEKDCIEAVVRSPDCECKSATVGEGILPFGFPNPGVSAEAASLYTLYHQLTCRRYHSAYFIMHLLRPLEYGYSFGGSRVTPNREEQRAKLYAAEAVNEVLMSYEMAKENTWMHDLYLSRNGIVRVMRDLVQVAQWRNMEEFLLVPSVTILTFDDSCSLWYEESLSLG